MNKRTLYAFIVSFILLVTVIVLNRTTLNKMREYSSWVNHTRQVITSFESISNDFKSAQVYTPTYKSDSLKNFYNLYKERADEIAVELSQLKTMVKDNPAQTLTVDSISVNINRHLPILMQKNIAEVITSGESWRINDFFLIHQMIDHGIEHEKDLLDHRAKVLASFTKLNNWLAISFGILAIAIFVFAFVNVWLLSRKRKWLEGFLESILNTSQNGVAYYKAIREQGLVIDFKIEFLNETYDDLLHMNSSSVIGKRLSEIRSFSWESGLVKKFVEVVETGNPHESEVFYKKDGAECWLLLSLAKLNDGVTASFHDISHLKAVEEELKNKIVDLERSNAELEQYAYIASHDLQEPLRKIRSFGSYLQDTQADKLDLRGQEMLDKIMSSADRMSTLIKDILNYSSLKKHTEFITVDLNEIVKGVQHDLDLLITQKGAVIQTESLPTIEAIPLQMTQLFYNLINNSLKFAKDDESPLIKISIRKMSSNEKKSSFAKDVDYYEIVLSDNGIGFDEAHSEHIFGVFKRLNNKALYPGSGIGLSLCKKVVENHNGAIYATAKENEGASFHIILPEKHV